MKLDLKILENEYWWGGSVNAGHLMPFDKNACLNYDLVNHVGGGNDQYSPLMLSSKGRYVWSEKPFTITVQNGVLTLEGEDFELEENCENLRGAYLTAMKKHFPFNEKMPDELFFKAVQYNTWIEVGTDQTTEKILKYAKEIIDGGMKPGVMMIDGGWQEDYGTYDFHRKKIPDPKFLMDELHKLGYKVMLWVSPIVASAGTQFKMIRDKGFLVKDKDGNVAIRKWWSGYSAVLDLTNPDARAWMQNEMNNLMTLYGVDGFKFDAGDAYFYDDEDLTYEKVLAREHTTYFNEVGALYPFNEFRAGYKFGGREIVARLHDKKHTWDNVGICALVPHTIAQGLLGYAYCCPDMVGGGDLVGANGLGEIDEELFIRWTQANALLGMMQMSIAPWRVLSKETYEIVKKYILLHAQFGDKFVELGKHASKTGEPITRAIAYQFPDENLDFISDEFMLGDDILVAPVIEKGVRERVVYLPKGKWQESDGTVYEGGRHLISAPLDKLIWFKKI